MTSHGCYLCLLLLSVILIEPSDANCMEHFEKGGLTKALSTLPENIPVKIMNKSEDIVVCSLMKDEDCNNKKEETCFLRECFKDYKPPCNEKAKDINVSFYHFMCLTDIAKRLRDKPPEVCEVYKKLCGEDSATTAPTIEATPSTAPTIEATPSTPLPTTPNIEATPSTPLPTTPNIEATPSTPLPTTPNIEATPSTPLPTTPNIEATPSTPLPTTPNIEATPSTPLPTAPTIEATPSTAPAIEATPTIEATTKNPSTASTTKTTSSTTSTTAASSLVNSQQKSSLLE
ncbi:integumentary mucin A.1-like isoform X2 [Oreochromis aureus]|uniref:integumentary mucin A.1-like isoform X2 n=1 Tax=Oreochromis aureus TaxID=47969 RepID=UPI001953D803|nr:integumentary mucin A.1-like isoform X2 [Oreochromis aureus]